MPGRPRSSAASGANTKRTASGSRSTTAAGPALGSGSDHYPGPEPGSGSAHRGWTARERQLLATALAVMQEFGYDRMSVDEVAARAQASKATVYRRWPSKADLAVAAFAEGISQVAVPPRTGTLRGDLLALGALITEQLRTHSSSIIGVLPELRRNPSLSAVMQREFLDQRKNLIHGVLREAVERGEIDADAISDDLWDVLPGYLIFRSLMPGRVVTEDTVVGLVDSVILPSLRWTSRDRSRPPS